MKSIIEYRVSSFSKTALNLRGKKRLQVANLFRTSAGHSPEESTNVVLPSGAYNKGYYECLVGNPNMDSQEHLCIQCRCIFGEQTTQPCQFLTHSADFMYVRKLKSRWIFVFSFMTLGRLRNILQCPLNEFLL